jgi:hypothetical protein
MQPTPKPTTLSLIQATTMIFNHLKTNLQTTQLLPILEPSTSPTILLGSTATGPIPQVLPPPNPPQNTKPTNLPQTIVPGGVNSIDSADENVVSGGEPAQNNTAFHCPWGNVGTYKTGHSTIQQLPINCKSYDSSYHSKIINDWDHPVPAVAN